MKNLLRKIAVFLFVGLMLITPAVAKQNITYDYNETLFFNADLKDEFTQNFIITLFLVGVGLGVLRFYVASGLIMIGLSLTLMFSDFYLLWCIVGVAVGTGLISKGATESKG